MPAAVQAPAYVMPAVEVGQIVIWYPTGEPSNEGLPAFVTRVGHGTVCLSVLYLNSYNLGLKDGVRHVKDPRRKTAELLENGAWDHTPATQRLARLEQRLLALEELATQPTRSGE